MLLYQLPPRGGEKPYYPGEREQRQYQQNSQQGIPLTPHTRQALLNDARQCGTRHALTEMERTS